MSAKLHAAYVGETVRVLVEALAANEAPFPADWTIT